MTDRSIVAERVEEISPLMFHHYDDRGVSDMHEGRFRVHFKVDKPLSEEWEATIAEWLRDNIAMPFEIEDYANPATPRFYDPPFKPVVMRCALLTNEGDAMLTYLHFA